MTFQEYCEELNKTQKYYNIFAYFCDKGGFKNKFNLSDEIEKEVKVLLGEMYQISKGIDDLLENGNIISSIILLRTLFERIILFRIIFEDKSKIEDKIKIYLDYGSIKSYEGLKNNEEENKSEYFKKFEEIFKEKSDLYAVKNKDGEVIYYNLYKGLLGEKSSINFLSEKYIKKPLEDYGIKNNFDFYSIFSDIHHGNPLNLVFLNNVNPFLENNNEERKEEINNFTIQLITLIGKDLDIRSYGILGIQ